jgi:hypothetical protein
VWDGYVLQTLSWISLERLLERAETSFYLTGIYPDAVEQIAGAPDAPLPRDPWGRPYRLVTRGQKLLVTGSDATGQPIQDLILSRHLAWEGSGQRTERPAGPGVELLP